MIRKAFRKIIGKPFESLEDMDKMVTRDLPIPDHGEPGHYIRFMAKRKSDGHWKILSQNNLEVIPEGFGKIVDAYQRVEQRHCMEITGKKKPINFDTAFLILREIEETLLKYESRKSVLTKEPAHHFMQAWRLAPKPLQDGLDELYAIRTAPGPVLEPKTRTAFAEKPPGRKFG